MGEGCWQRAARRRLQAGPLGARHRLRATAAAATATAQRRTLSKTGECAKCGVAVCGPNYGYREAPPVRMRLFERSRGISTVTSSPYEDAPSCRRLFSLDAQCSTRPSSSRQLGSNEFLFTGILMRLFPRRRRGLLLVVTMTMEAFAMRSEGRTARAISGSDAALCQANNVIHGLPG
jgi:hypothetical protein